MLDLLVRIRCGHPRWHDEQRRYPLARNAGAGVGNRLRDADPPRALRARGYQPRGVRSQAAGPRAVRLDVKTCCDDVPLHVAEGQRRVLQIVLWINVAMFLAEFVAGIVAHSTSLLADSVDMLGDAIVYGFSLYAVGRGAEIGISYAVFCLKKKKTNRGTDGAKVNSVRGNCARVSAVTGAVSGMFVEMAASLDHKRH